MSDGSPSCVDGKTTVYSCMEDLQLQLLIVFAAKQFAMKIVGIGAPLFKAAASEKAHQLQYKLLKDATKNKWNTLSLTYLLRCISLSAVSCKLNLQSFDNQSRSSVQVNEQLTRPEYDGVFMDYSELAIQFGYSTLFATAFPLAPAMCVVSNIIELRLDAYQLR